MRVCSRCGETKSVEAFSVRRSRPSGRNSHCKDCVKVKNKADYAKNAVRRREYAAAYREQNPDQIKEYMVEYRDANRERLNEYYCNYAKKHPHRKQFVTVSRRARKLQATPSWANQTYIALFYELARLESEQIGVAVHVDHIVPLQSSLVCGLHCEHNLQLLVASANLKKSNRVWPDMPN